MMDPLRKCKSHFRDIFREAEGSRNEKDQFNNIMIIKLYIHNIIREKDNKIIFYNIYKINTITRVKKYIE